MGADLVVQAHASVGFQRTELSETECSPYAGVLGPGILIVVIVEEIRAFAENPAAKIG